MPTITTRPDTFGIVIPVDEKYYLSDKQINQISKWNSQQKPLEIMERTDKTQLSPTLTARGQEDMHGGLILIKGNYSPSNHNAARIVDKNGIAPTVMENHGTITAVEDNLRIRKITPLECFRLQGFSDKAFNKAKQVCSDSQLYKQAGNSIPVNVLEEIFTNLLLGGSSCQT